MGTVRRQVDPFNWDLKKGLQAASDGVMRDLVSGAQPITQTEGWALDLA